MKRLSIFALACLAVSSVQSDAAAANGETLQRVQDRGNLVCGVSGTKPGLAHVNSDGSFEGFDVDICRAVASAIFGDPDQVEFVAVPWPQVFPMARTGQVDIMNRNQTFTIGRDVTMPFDFFPVFYSGQAFMVRADTGVTDVAGLSGASICVTAGSTQPLVIGNYFDQRGWAATTVPFDDTDLLFSAFEAGRCDAVTSEPPTLAARRTALAEPDAYVILPQMISKEPMGPMVLEGDSNWSNIVRTTIHVLYQAEEFDINSSNVKQIAASSQDAGVRYLLGVDGEFGETLGLPREFGRSIIEGVGNYGEIWERHLGPDTPLALDRGLNRLWSDGGVLYSPPFR